VIKSILAAGVVREYESQKKNVENVDNGMHIEGVDDAELRYAIDNEFTAEQKARLHNIVNIFTHKDKSKSKYQTKSTFSDQIHFFQLFH